MAPRTRRMARDERFPLLALPDELLVHAASELLIIDLPSALALAQTCRATAERLQRVRECAEAFRLRWVPDLTRTCHILGYDGRSLVRCDGKNTWSCCGLLQPTGASSWSVRVERSALNRGRMIIGVCTEDGLHGWGLSLMNGRLVRWCRKANGLLERRTRRDEEEAGGAGVERPLHYVPPPEGFPDGHNEQLLFDDATGLNANLKGRAEGTNIDVTFDASAGCLAFRVEGGTELRVHGFPRGVTLRPWARLFYSVGDRVTICPYVRWVPNDDSPALWSQERCFS